MDQAKNVIKQRQLIRDIQYGALRFEERTGLKPNQLYVGFLDFNLLQRSELYAQNIALSLAECESSDNFSQKFDGMEVFTVNVERHIGFSRKVIK